MGAGDPRIAGKTGIGGGIRDDEKIAALERVRAERCFPDHVELLSAEGGFEPQVRFIDEPDNGDGQAAAFGGHLGEVVEAVGKGRIEDPILLENLESGGLVLNHGNRDHFYSNFFLRPELSGGLSVTAKLEHF